MNNQISKGYDVILISPHLDYDGEGTPIKIEKKYASSPYPYVVPLGLTIIAQHLYNSGFKVKLLHLPSQFNKTLQNNLKYILRKYPSKLLFIQCHWFLYGGGATKVAKTYKSLFPNSKIFLGGSLASYSWKEILTDYDFIEGIVLGEGEKTCQKLAEQIINKEKIKDVGGCAYRSGNKIIFEQPTSKSILDIGDIPFLELGKEIFDDINFTNEFALSICRGKCPGKCIHCSINSPFNVREFEHLSIGKIIEQIQIYQNKGIKNVYVCELEFSNTKFIEELAKKIKKENFDLLFELEAHPLLFKKETTKKLVDANFLSFIAGCESGSNKILRIIKRNLTKENILDAVKNVTENNGVILTSWIANLPYENNNDFQETLGTMKKIVEMGGHIHWIENLAIIHGSELYEKAEQFKIVPSLKSFSDLIKVVPQAKTFVDFKEIEDDPIKYLKYEDKTKSFSERVRRFKEMRLLAANTADICIGKLIKNKFINSSVANRKIRELKDYKSRIYKMAVW